MIDTVDASRQVVPIFWTSGWDSTFRVLQLLLVGRRRVQPYYLIADMRASSDVERARMDAIREALFKRDSSLKEVLSWRRT